MTMAILIITLLVLTSLAVVTYPFLARRAVGGVEDPTEELVQQLRRDRDRIYEEIRVLQQERFLKHVSDEEYHTQIQAARMRAGLLLQQQHHAQQTVEGINEAVEEEMRRALAVPNGLQGPPTPDASPPDKQPPTREPMP